MRLSDQLTLKIKALIEQHGLKAGDRLPSERTLAEQFNVSRPPVREALRSLASHGLVITRASGGTYLQSDAINWPQKALQPISQFIAEDPSYRSDVLEVRQALEVSAARLAALRATAADKKNIQQCYDTMIHHQELGEPDLAAQADAQFHLAITQASQNLVLLQVMRGLFDLLQTNIKDNRSTLFASSPNTLAALTQQHQELLQAILENDAIKAKQAARHHLDYVSSAQQRWNEDAARQQRAARPLI